MRLSVRHAVLSALAVLASAIPAASGPALAQQGGAPVPLSAFSITFGVSARGVSAAEATYAFTFGGGRYQGTASHRLVGVARTLGGDSQDYSYTVSGLQDPDGDLRPRSYRHSGGSRGRVVQTSFSDSAVTTAANPPMGMGNPPATAAQKLGTIDQVTMIAQMLVARGDPCRQTLRIFLEGRRRFDLTMSPRGTEAVNVPGFRGQAARCQVRFTPIAGFSDPTEAATLTFLFAPVNGYNVPVQIQMPTDDAGLVRLQARRFTLTGRR